MGLVRASRMRLMAAFLTSSPPKVARDSFEDDLELDSARFFNAHKTAVKMLTWIAFGK